MDVKGVEKDTLNAFMDGPFLQWLRCFPEAPHDLTFDELSSGIFLNNVLLSLDAAFSSGLPLQNPTDHLSKVTNIENIIKNLVTFYQDALQQTVVAVLPSSLSICSTPTTEDSLKEMDKLLLLVLGAAVQSSQKEEVIQSIKGLPVEIQHDFMTKITKVTDNPSHVWSSDLDDPTQMSVTRKDDLYVILVKHLKKLVEDRDAFAHQIVELSISNYSSNLDLPRESSKITPERNHLAYEISEYKATIRKLKQLLEEKTEASSETTEEMNKYMTKCKKLREENLSLTQEARSARTLRDELDVLRERANKVLNLEAELQSYKDKIGQMESLKSRHEELKEEKNILSETNKMLEQRLEKHEARNHQIFALESEILRLQTDLDNEKLENDTSKTKILDLEEEILLLQSNARSSMSESQSLIAEMQHLQKLSKNRDTNIQSEQIGQELSRVRRLELEIQILKAENEELKIVGFRDASEKLQRLEKENKQLTVTMQQLESSHTKDAEFNVNLTKENNKLSMKTKELVEVVSTMKETEEQMRIEKDTIISNLTKQVDSLRRRQEQNQNEQINSLEEENKKLVKERTLLQTQVSKLQHENQLLQERLSEMKDSLERMEEMTSERETLQSEIVNLRQANGELLSSSEMLEKVLLQKEELENAYESVSKRFSKLKKDWENLSAENLRLKNDATRIGHKFDAIKSEQQKVQILESERDDLRDECARLKVQVENLSITTKSVEDQEKKLSTVMFENSRLSRQVDTMKRKMGEIESENKFIETENQKLQKTIENLKTTARKVEQLEKDNFELESAQHKMERENKSMVRDVERLKQSIEEKDIALEEVNIQKATLEREKNKLARDLETLNSDQSKNFELEKENRRLTQQCLVDKRAQMKLHEELVGEKLKCDNLTQQLSKVDKKLKSIGIDVTSLEQDFDDVISNERIRNLEGSMTELLKSHEKKIKALEVTLKEVKQEKMTLEQNLEVLQLKADGGNSKDQISNLVKEREILKNDASKLQMELLSTRNKVDAYKQKLRQLQEESVSLQVENSTLQSQSTSLLSQINQLQTTQASLESSKRKLEDSERTWKTERDDLLRDQAGLQKLHDNLSQDYDKILKERDSFKDIEKQLREEIRRLETLKETLSEDLNRAQDTMNGDRESYLLESRTMTNLRAEHVKLKDDFRMLFKNKERLEEEYEKLVAKLKTLKTQSNHTKSSNSELKIQLQEAKEQMNLLDVELTKASNRCEVLNQMNMTLEEDRRSLMDQVSLLLTQYHDLLTQTMDDKDHFHREERCFADKVNNLSRQKEKLEEKIFEQYKRMESQTPKKMGFGGQIGKYIKKAGSNLMLTSNKSRNIRQGGPTSRTSLSSGSIVTASRGDADGRNEDSSSMGSEGNDSFGSGQNSPNEIPRSESVIELGTKKSSFSSTQLQKSGFRKSMPTHLEDSDGNNADDDSIDSFMHRQNNFGFSDDVPTRDVGPERLPNLFCQTLPNDHTKVGLPIIPSSDNRTRFVSRVNINGSKENNDGSSTQHFSSWKGRQSGSPSHSNGEITPPVVPARKHSRAGCLPDMPPQRPPKPSSNRRSSDDNSDHSQTIEDDLKKENTEWLEYGCV